MSNKSRGRAPTPSFLSGEQRINKLLAAAGFGSRRQVDELLAEGRVEIDGQIITQVGTKVDADKSKILVDGEPLRRHKPVYFAVHKPAGFLCTNADPEGRPRVIELVPNHTRLFPVGRLDSSSTGLILLTNDGELSQRLAHPKHGVPKTYFVVVAGQVDREALKRLQRGIYLAEGIARVDGATIRRVRKGCTEIDITLSEGKNREIRRVLARLGHKVVVLRRISIASLKLGDLPEGAYRPLSEKEVAGLYKSVDDLRSARNQDRRDRKRRSDERRVDAVSSESSVRDALPSGKSQTKNKGPVASSQPKTFIPFDEESDDYESMPLSTDDELESLPSLSQNPYRMPDDEEMVGLGVEDAILVKDGDWDEDFEYDIPKTTGAVLGAEDDELQPKRAPNRDRNRERVPSANQGRSTGRGRPTGRPSGRPNGRTGPSGGGRGAGRTGDGRSGTGRPTAGRSLNRRPEGSRSGGPGRPEGRPDARTRSRTDDGAAGGAGSSRSRSDSRGRSFSNREGGEGSRGGRGGQGGSSFRAGPSGGRRKPTGRTSDRSASSSRSTRGNSRPKR
ncbi:pseudouridine synthase [Pirellulaceae bacterium SH449]